VVIEPTFGDSERYISIPFCRFGGCFAHGCSSASVAGSGMVLTATTLENLAQVKEACENPIPLLLEGSTGCGKSACVAEAARQKGVTCLRLNMSSRVTVDDLIGKVTLEGREDFKFVKRQFTVAFEEGLWLLLDEVNLASDVVLQAIGTIVVCVPVAMISSLRVGLVTPASTHCL
jgi:midasin (ATPase involved in ribosome maturation)